MPNAFTLMKRNLSLILGTFLITAAIGVSFFVQAAWLSQPGAGAPVKISVASVDRLPRVTDKLIDGGVLSNWFGYRLYSMLDSSATRPKAGEYLVRKGTSYRALARILALGPEREEISLTLIEGKTLDDEAVLLESYDVKSQEFWGLAGKSKNALLFSRQLVQDYPFLADAPKSSSLEGYLYPDTYRVWKDQLPAGLVRKQLDEFTRKVVEPYDDERRASGMSWHEVITLASIVEAEVRGEEDRKIVAGVFLTRLREKMRLQTDATLNYALDSGRSRANAKDLSTDTPYNSYLYEGLPPGPIGNPSLQSIRAVLDPKMTGYRYFLTDQEGRVFYAKTYDEHLANKRRAFGS
ncbi:MAG TPA: endolytic transglycosylase MltG [Candidatus Methylomirabilis sp.]|nr:endolytic transglycosylase MltG [Candidatus Methylomirabilis sp.]